MAVMSKQPIATVWLLLRSLDVGRQKRPLVKLTLAAQDDCIHQFKGETMTLLFSLLTLYKELYLGVKSH